MTREMHLYRPAFNSKDGWETEITVRNTTKAAVIAKAVLYDAYDTHELKDFNLYLSSHDVARFKIKKNTITTRDGSIMAGIDPSLGSSNHEFVPHENPSNIQYVENPRTDTDGDYIISDFGNKDGNSGYVVIYVMAQTQPLEGNITDEIFGYDRYHNEGIKQTGMIDYM